MTTLSPPPPSFNPLKLAPKSLIPPKPASASEPDPSVTETPTPGPNPTQSPTTLLHLAFNQDHTCFSAATDFGFRVYTCDPFRHFHSDPSGLRSGVGFVQMLFHCHYFPVFGSGPDPDCVPPDSKPLIDDFSLTLNVGDRCLLVGSNGADKTMILRILGGKHMVDPSMVRVLGRSAFHDTALTGFGDLSYLGGEWRRDVAFVGFDVPIQMDVWADKLIKGELHIHLGYVLLLDEITVDLDVLVRADLLQFLRKECDERGAMIVSQAPNCRERV
ncbi:ABC transporter I family member 20 [Rosa chinensis]|uniref:ABC transporter I family member 20 n=1 Tax=Rosa chinensis TaxID=74649 RepID=UPI001AD920C6|nr:ABC transporter I family member 20 [Rosa chinensis]